LSSGSWKERYREEKEKVNEAEKVNSFPTRLRHRKVLFSERNLYGVQNILKFLGIPTVILNLYNRQFVKKNKTNT